MRQRVSKSLPGSTLGTQTEAGNQCASACPNHFRGHRWAPRPMQEINAPTRVQITSGVTVWARGVKSECQKPARGVKSECQKLARGVKSECQKPARGVKSECQKPARGVKSECQKTARGVKSECQKPARVSKSLPGSPLGTQTDAGNECANACPNHFRGQRWAPRPKQEINAPARVQITSGVTVGHPDRCRK